jgi:hypothetical protein
MTDDELEYGDQPAQSDFCSLDICDDDGYIPSSTYINQSIDNREPRNAHSSQGQDVISDLGHRRETGGGEHSEERTRKSQYSRNLRNTDTHPNSHSFSRQNHEVEFRSADPQVFTSRSESLDRHATPTGDFLEDQNEAKSFPIRRESETEYHRTEHELDFIRLASSQDASMLNHRVPTSEYISDYGGLERGHTRSRISAHEDLCNFYEEQVSPVHTSTDCLGDVDHPLDIAWLSDRCDGDVHLLVAVLETFCQQGANHCAEITSAAQRGDMEKLRFHTVSRAIGSYRGVPACLS